PSDRRRNGGGRAEPDGGTLVGLGRLRCGEPHPSGPAPALAVEVMTSERVHLTIPAARELAEAALRGIGYDAEEAWIVPYHVPDAAFCGYEYPGLPKILNLPTAPRFRLPMRPISVERETPVSLQLDGGNQLGMIAVYRATELAIAKAQSAGIALVGLS